MRFSISHIMAGATAGFVGYSSAVVLILEAVKASMARLSCRVPGCSP